MPRPSEAREPIEILKEIEGISKTLKELLEEGEGSPGLFELNMGLSIAQGLQKTSGKLSKRIDSKLRQMIFEEGEEKHGRTSSKTVEGNGKRHIRINLKKHKA